MERLAYFTEWIQRSSHNELYEKREYAPTSPSSKTYHSTIVFSEQLSRNYIVHFLMV